MDRIREAVRQIPDNGVNDRPRMSFTVFLGNLPVWVTKDDIKSWLNAENLVYDDVKVIRNPETQESKGFAFIDTPNSEEMNSIIRRFDRAPLEDRLLRANQAQPPKSKGAGPRAGRSGESQRTTGRPPSRAWRQEAQASRSRMVRKVRTAPSPKNSPRLSEGARKPARANVCSPSFLPDSYLVPSSCSGIIPFISGILNGTCVTQVFTLLIHISARVGGWLRE